MGLRSLHVLISKKLKSFLIGMATSTNSWRDIMAGDLLRSTPELFFVKSCFLQYPVPFDSGPGGIEFYDVAPMPSTSAVEQSRRIILRNLLPNAKLPQTARGIQTHGQVLKITL